MPSITSIVNKIRRAFGLPVKAVSRIDGLVAKIERHCSDLAKDEAELVTVASANLDAISKAEIEFKRFQAQKEAENQELQAARKKAQALRKNLSQMLS